MDISEKELSSTLTMLIEACLVIVVYPGVLTFKDLALLRAGLSTCGVLI